MRILKVEPGKAPYAKEMAEGLKAIQREVEGLFQPLSMGDGVILCCNDEGKLNGMQPNRRLGDDIICGPFFLAGDPLVRISGLVHCLNDFRDQLHSGSGLFLYEYTVFVGRGNRISVDSLFFVVAPAVSGKDNAGDETKQSFHMVCTSFRVSLCF